MSLSDPISREEHAAMSCAGKQRFDTIALAQQVCQRPRRAGKRRTFYRCQHCSGYHLGTPNRKRLTR